MRRNIKTFFLQLSVKPLFLSRLSSNSAGGRASSLRISNQYFLNLGVLIKKIIRTMTARTNNKQTYLDLFLDFLHRLPNNQLDTRFQIYKANKNMVFIFFTMSETLQVTDNDLISRCIIWCSEIISVLIFKNSKLLRVLVCYQ